MRTTVPVVVAFLSGFVMVVSFFFNPDRTFIGRAQDVVLQWATIVSGFTLVLGVFSIVRVNGRAVARRSQDWFYKLMTVVSVFAMAIPAMLPVSADTRGGRIIFSILPESWGSLFGTGPNSIYDWLFNYLDSPMMETMFAMLAFYIASAAYRAFRARSADATLLLLTATIVMLWRVPMGEAFLRLFGESVPDYLNTFIMNGFNVAVQRGIIIGAALGAASMSLRIMLGIERTYMGKG
ncbi:MAG: hypothetical protein JSV44_02700 [Candidatus Zixiibacteriota bacterium]|nr:MAG: hypothetical protein JSV44_02700 [candidate division Zixibacteria bacterium]